jgi:hypothetical protein
VKGQKVKPGKKGHESGEVKIMQGKERGRKPERERVNKVNAEEVIVRMRGQDGLTEREDDDRSGGNVWMTA